MLFGALGRDGFGGFRGGKVGVLGSIRTQRKPFWGGFLGFGGFFDMALSFRRNFDRSEEFSTYGSSPAR